MSAATTVFVTTTVTASATPLYHMNATEQAQIDRGKTIGQWTAIGVLGVYVLLGFCLFSVWLARRIRRQPQVVPAGLPPEATQHGKGAFLVPTIRKKRARKGTMNSTYSAMTQETTGARSVRSMFYEGPGVGYAPYRSQINISSVSTSERSSPSPPRTSHGRKYSSSQTNLIPLQNQPVTREQEYVAWDANAEVRPASRRNRSSSQSTLRYYYEESSHQEPMPTLPDVALVGGAYR